MRSAVKRSAARPRSWVLSIRPSVLRLDPVIRAGDSTSVAGSAPQVSPTCVHGRPLGSGSVAAAALALLSSLLWGGADFSGGLLARRRALFSVLLVAQASAVLVAVVLVVVDPSDRPDAAGVAWGIAGGFVGAGALAAFYRGLSIGTMSIVAPVTAVGAVVPVAVGVAGGERPGAL